MKTILIDAWNTLFTESGIDEEIKRILDSFENKKIVLTNADDEQIVKFGIDKSPYEVFSLKHNPNKIDENYYKIFLEKYNLSSGDVIYIEHNFDAIKSAEKNNILSYHFDKGVRDLKKMREFLESNL